MPSAAESMLSDVRELAPSLAARAAEHDAARRLSPALVAELKALGVFRMLVPRSHGGLEIDFPSSVEILAAVAAGDGATGWSVRSCSRWRGWWRPRRGWSTCATPPAAAARCMRSRRYNDGCA